MNVIGLIRELTPPFIWAIAKRVFKRIPKENESSQRQILKGRFFCPVCGNNVVRFEPLPLYYEQMQEKYPSEQPQFLGEMMNTHAYLCPHCHASDRDRLYAMYMSKKFEGINKSNNLSEIAFLDFAPSSGLQQFVKKYDFIKYRSADLYMEGVDDKVDIVDMNIYKDNQFDVLLCSHVLEHIKNDKKAMSELYRVLKIGGWGIVVVPINLGLENDFEDEKYTSEEDRWKYFGQNDHVRAYSKKGFVSKLESVGFKVQQYGMDYFGMAEFERCGIHPRSVLYVVSK